MFSILINRAKSNSHHLLKKLFWIRNYSSSIRENPRNDLFRRISSTRNPNSDVVPLLDQWIEDGKKVRKLEFQLIVRVLRSRKLYTHALQFSEWMSSKDLSSFTSGDRAVELDLVGAVRGVDAAECYFNNLTDQEKNDKAYGALFSCYTREGLIDKSLNHFQKMKEIGYASSALAYNNLMCLYSQTGLLEKIPEVLSEMKKNGVSPNNFSYRICISAYGERSDLNSIEKLLKEMETLPHFSVDWLTYSAVANIFIKASLKEKAIVMLKKVEEKVEKNAVGYNHLISLYAHLGNKDEVMRVWGLQEVACKKHINMDYITILGMLVKLDELEIAEGLLEEWKSSCVNYDFRVPNTLLIGYCQKGLLEKAEKMLRNIIKTGKTPTPNSWAIIALGHLDNKNVEKAWMCMEEALKVREQNPGWRPKPRLISGILNWLSEERDVKKLEALLSSLTTVVPVDSEMYQALDKTIIRLGNDVNGNLENIEADKIDEDEPMTGNAQ